MSHELQPGNAHDASGTPDHQQYLDTFFAGGLPDGISKLTIPEAIATAHEYVLEDNFSAVVMCGSITTRKKLTSESDVDYITVLPHLSREGLMGASVVRERLSQEVGVSMSNTIITVDEVRQFTTDPASLDGKATQALIEAANRPARVLGPAELDIELPTDDLVRDYSARNLTILGHLIRKTIARAAPEMPPSTQKSLAKIALIAMKMKKQHTDPTRFSQVPSGDFMELHFAERPDTVLFDTLKEAKTDTTSHDARQIVDGVVSFLDRTILE